MTEKQRTFCRKRPNSNSESSIPEAKPETIRERERNLQKITLSCIWRYRVTAEAISFIRWDETEQSVVSDEGHDVVLLLFSILLIISSSSVFSHNFFSENTTFSSSNLELQKSIKFRRNFDEKPRKTMIEGDKIELRITT